LAARPLSLTELDRLIVDVNYPALERRLTAMRRVGQITAVSDRGAPTRYRLTTWMRKAVAPILAVCDWEGRSGIDRAVMGRMDAEGIFLLMAPLLNISDSVGGTCRLAIELDNGAPPERAGVVICVEPGRRLACRSDRRIAAPTWACGPVAAWSDCLGLRRSDPIELGGDRGLAEALIGDLRRVLGAGVPMDLANSSLGARENVSMAICRDKPSAVGVKSGRAPSQCSSGLD
jgi:hypothetical protein